MDDLNHNGSDKLRKGRISIAGARYFLTITTRERRFGLTDGGVPTCLMNAFRILHKGGDIEFQCSTIMPDHLHVLVVLGQRLSLSQVVRKFKRLTKSQLLSRGIEWQSNFFDHRLRLDDASEAFARYIFLNPYRKGLIQLEATWPWWTVSANYRPEFLGALSLEGYPPSEWLGNQLDLVEIIESDRVEG